MTQINTLDISDELFTQIQDMALTQACSINQQIVALLQQALTIEAQRQAQTNVLQAIHQARWTPPPTVPDSVALLREIRGYDE